MTIKYSLLCAAAILTFSASNAQATVGSAISSTAASSSITMIAIDASAAEKTIQNMAQEGIDFLADQSLSQTQRKDKFKALLQRNFDMGTIGRFALGRYWKSANTAQQKEYLHLFEQMVLNVYARRFDEYKGQDLLVTGSRPEGKRDILVNSVIKQPSGPDVKVDWRLREKNGRNKVIDIIVEGVSMTMTQRADFASVIQRGGGNVEVLLEELRKN
ncbi:MAG: ABC transporter substrate-binding protein [Micavibrio sp.]|nr:ABC transporter substrate-binding protein [Micavibrio sp.]